MFLRDTTRKKNGKEHRYYSLVENRRVAGGRVVQRPALYLGEINDGQQEAWRKTIEIFEEGQARPRNRLSDKRKLSTMCHLRAISLPFMSLWIAAPFPEPLPSA